MISPKDVVGIKTNNWHFLSTPKPLEEAIKQRVLKVGVPEDKISLKDWGVRTDPNKIDLIHFGLVAGSYL